MRHVRLLPIGAMALTALTVLGVSGLLGGGAHAGSGDITLVAIDMDVSGNDDTTVGTIEQCQELSAVGQTHTFDLVVQGVDLTDKIKGYQIDIDYDPAVVRVISVIDVDAAGSVAPNDVTIISRIDSSGGPPGPPPGFVPLTHISDPMPDSDGSIQVAAVDSTTTPPPPANHESGDGVLARITVEAVGSGTSGLAVGGAADDLMLIAGDGPLVNNPVPVSTVEIGAISVGEPCAVPTPTPTPGPSPTPTPGPSPTPTPTPPPLPEIEVNLDVDTEGNSAVSAGTLETCNAIGAVGETIQVDMVAKGVPPYNGVGGGVNAFQFDLVYDPAVVKVLSFDADMMLTAEGEGILLSLSDPVPDADGAWLGAELDMGGVNYESGDGVLMRMTLQAVGEGVSTLVLDELLSGTGVPIVVDGSDGGYPVSGVFAGEVVVGGTCTDRDGDGFADTEEAFVGTSPADDCADTSEANDEVDDKWPADLDDDQQTNILDIVQLTPPYFNTNPPDPKYSVRKDFNGDHALNILDIVRLTPPTFNTSCTP